jgi:DMSO/TMAO reductase YedYZ molybdopterin-dependent catalytic subunit
LHNLNPAEPSEGATEPERLVLRPSPLNIESPPEAFRSFLTPAEQRFVRSHFPVPPVEPERELRIEGAVARPLALSPAELRALPARTVTVTTECAGNHRATLRPPTPGEQWGGGALSTAQWTGAPLALVLEKASVLEAAVEAVFRGSDCGDAGDGAGFARSLPRDRALDRDTLIAWEMNGGPIPHQHGGPVRLIVPGWYGMASVKWLERIELVEEPFAGRFQTESYVYAPGAPVTWTRVKSMILEPGPSARSGRLVIRGLAWGGQGGIERVEVALGCTDRDWRPARLVGPALPYAWRRFELDWDAKPGTYVLRSRAFDATGATQPDEPERNELGYGANGLLQRSVIVG